MLTIAETAKKYGIKPLKKYGQNFIFDMSLCQKIVRASRIITGSHILEIGPGTAGLTRAILEINPSRLTVVETDYRFIQLLKDLQSEYPNLEIIKDDALKFDINDLKGGIYSDKIHIISNLPYNIGTKLLTNWLKRIDMIDSITIMLQKEVADRIRAISGSKEYGRLSVISNIICDVEKCLDVSKHVFYPSPKVDSTVIRLTPKLYRPSQNIIKRLEDITKQAFSQRRKTLKSSLKGLGLEEAVKYLNINDNLRAENISSKQYLELAIFSLKTGDKQV